MSKILWHSNAPWSPTGYGNQTRLMTPFVAERYDVAISSFYGLEGGPLKWDGIPVLPGLGQDFGNLYLAQHAERFFDGDRRNGLVVTLMDVWVLETKAMAKMNVACWVPVDHEPAPASVTDFFTESGAIPIAMSRFGQRQLDALSPLYCPHAIDTEIYHPHDQTTVRRNAFPEGAFVVGMVAANKGRPSRKCFTQALQAFKRFSDAHDNAYLYLHTTLDPNVAAGENIVSLIRALGIPMERVQIADQYALLFKPYTDEDMAQVYSAMDVLLNPSMGEGFGIPVIEAQACGRPAIVTDATAMPEVCGSGWHVKNEPLWTGQNSWQFMPSVDDIVAALEECIGLKAREYQMLSNAARQHALNYDTRRVAKMHMLPALAEAERRFADRNPVTIAPRLRAA